MTALALSGRPLVWFDVETTGAHPEFDRVIEIGVLKVAPDGLRKEWRTYVDPEAPIPPEVTEHVHGIDDAKVAGAPKFRELAPGLFAGFRGADVGGYNVRFDMRCLRAEFKRCGAGDPFEGARIVDPNRIYHARARRTLGAAVRDLLGREHEGAHSALEDVRATAEVADAMLERWPDLPRDVAGLHELFFQWPDGPLKVDVEGKFEWRFGEACFSFGKMAGRPLRSADRGYLEWIVRGDFSADVREIARNALAGRYPRRVARPGEGR